MYMLLLLFGASPGDFVGCRVNDRALRVILNATFTFDLQLRSTTSILDVERVSVSLRQWCFLTGVRVRVVVLRWCCCCHVALAGCPLGALLQLATVIPTDCGVHELLGFFSEL